MATIKQIRDAVTATVAALPAFTSRSITPRAVWIPQRDRTDALPDVMVAPATREVELVGRGVRSDLFSIQIGVCEDLAPSGTLNQETVATAGQVLIDAVIDGLLGVRIGGPANPLVVSARHLVLNAPSEWRQLNQFVGVVELTLRC